MPGTSRSRRLRNHRQADFRLLDAWPGVLCAVALLGGTAPLGCGPPPPLPTTEPIVVRSGHALVVEWSNAPAGSAIPIYAGPAPDRIDRSAPVAELTGTPARIPKLPFSGRPYFELVPRDALPILLAERTLELEGAPNFRDLGGYRTRAGRRVAWGRAFRSGQLAGLRARDLEKLAVLPLRLVIDFRTAEERKAEPDRLPAEPAPRVVDEPIETPGFAPATVRHEILDGTIADVDFRKLLPEAYEGFITGFSDRYRTMFEQILSNGPQPFVVHCTGGKDRTGVASALILLALGVPEPTVMQDYLLTDHYLYRPIERRLALIRALSLFRADPEQIRDLLSARPRYLEAALHAMRARAGSIDAYLERDLGMGPGERQRLRGLLLEPE